MSGWGLLTEVNASFVRTCYDKRHRLQAAKTSVLSLPGVRSVGAAYTLVKMSRYCLMFWLPYFLKKQARVRSAGG